MVEVPPAGGSRASKATRDDSMVKVVACFRAAMKDCTGNDRTSKQQMGNGGTCTGEDKMQRWRKNTPEMVLWRGQSVRFLKVHHLHVVGLNNDFGDNNLSAGAAGYPPFGAMIEGADDIRSAQLHRRCAVFDVGLGAWAAWAACWRLSLA